ncbi:MAG: YhbY family RNA-binding protein [Verrucomicrobiota bacterium]|jgi:RNA-binding protein|nr:MAG: YhbY family RNA-binding protein [Verrucomicrobiota bacterium]
MSLPELTGHQRTHLRGLGQTMDPVIKLGKEGLTAAFLKEFERCFSDKDLIKLRFLGADRHERAALCDQLSQKASCLCVGAVGHTALFFKPHANPAKSSLVEG